MESKSYLQVWIVVITVTKIGPTVWTIELTSIQTCGTKCNLISFLNILIIWIFFNVFWIFENYMNIIRIEKFVHVFIKFRQIPETINVCKYFVRLKSACLCFLKHIISRVSLVKVSTKFDIKPFKTAPTLQFRIRNV